MYSNLLLSKEKSKQMLTKFVEENIDGVINGTISSDTVIEAAINLGVFDSEKSAKIFMLEAILKTADEFDIEYPIAYYNNPEEFKNDTSEVDTSDIEPLTDDYIKSNIIDK